MASSDIKIMIIDFFISFGVIIGGSLIGGIGFYLVHERPLTEIYELASRLKIWAIIAAIGGTFETFYTIEKGLFYGTTDELIRHSLYIFSAMLGAHSATIIIGWLTGRSFFS